MPRCVAQDCSGPYGCCSKARILTDSSESIASTTAGRIPEENMMNIEPRRRVPRSALRAGTVFVPLLALLLPPLLHAGSCESLENLVLANTTIDSSAVEAAGPSRLEGIAAIALPDPLPERCLV